MKKRIFSMVMVCVMVIASIAPVQATEVGAEYEIVATTNVVEVDGFSFEITEAVDENYNLTRTFERNFVPFSASTDYEFANALLLALGFTQETIDMMSSEALASVATTTFAIANVSYSVQYDDGYRQVTPSYAYQRASYMNELQAQYLETYGSIRPLNEDWYTRNINSGVMQIHHGAFRIGNSRTYLFATSGHWLSMPFARLNGSIGQMGSNVSVNSHTISAQASYLLPNGTRRFTPVTVGEDRDGNWEGAAGRFRLPEPSFLINNPHNFQAVITFEGTVRGTGLDNYPMNTAGTYSHQSMAINFGSVGISARGISIGLSLAFSPTDITAPSIQIWR